LNSRGAAEVDVLVELVVGEDEVIVVVSVMVVCIIVVVDVSSANK
jgi:hypothetical protein